MDMAARGELSVRTAEAWNSVMAMLTAALLMSFCWCFLRLPEANLLMVTFCFLSALTLYPVADGWQRFRQLIPMAFSAMTLQFLIGVCREDKLLLVILPSLAAAAILRFLPGKSAACSMCIVGYLAFFAPGSWLPAVDRAFGIALGIPVVLLADALFHSRLPETSSSDDRFSLGDSLKLGSLLAVGTWLAEALDLAQGAWIMLTILFICQSCCNGGNFAEASLERIIAVPLGLLLGGLFLGCLVFFDYRFIYLLFPFGALGFYLLRCNGDFWGFTVLFMMAFSIYADWATGDIHRFHFAELVFQRTVATLIGSVFMMVCPLGTGERRRR